MDDISLFGGSHRARPLRSIFIFCLKIIFMRLPSFDERHRTPCGDAPSSVSVGPSSRACLQLSFQRKLYTSDWKFSICSLFPVFIRSVCHYCQSRPEPAFSVFSRRGGRHHSSQHPQPGSLCVMPEHVPYAMCWPGFYQHQIITIIIKALAQKAVGWPRK